jgi:hypothetical protein
LWNEVTSLFVTSKEGTSSEGQQAEGTFKVLNK